MSSPQTDTRPDRQEAILIAGTPEDGAVLAPLATAIAARGQARPVLVATGMDPMSVHEALERLGSPADVTLLVHGSRRTAAEETAVLLSRLDGLIAERMPAVVLVCGCSPAALAGTQAACLREIPVVYLDSSADPEAAELPPPAAHSMICRLASMHLVVSGPGSVPGAGPAEPAANGVPDLRSRTSTEPASVPATA